MYTNLFEGVATMEHHTGVSWYKGAPLWLGCLGHQEELPSFWGHMFEGWLATRLLAEETMDGPFWKRMKREGRSVNSAMRGFLTWTRAVPKSALRWACLAVSGLCFELSRLSLLFHEVNGQLGVG